MIAEAVALAKANPILLAGLGTVAFGSVMYVIKGVPIWLFATAKRLLTIQVDLNSESALFREILDLLSRHRVTMLARLFTTDHGGNVVAGYGNSLSFWRGTFISFKRELIEKNYKLDEKVSLTIYSRRVAVLETLIAAAQLPPPANTITIYTAGNGYVHSRVKKRKRAIASVFANGNIIERLVAKIEWFQANEEWYQRRGIPYKLVILLHGPPGTGKSSLVYALASHFNAGLCSITNMVGFDRSIGCSASDAFLLIEDIDMLTITRETEAQRAAGDVSPPRDSRSADDKTAGIALNALQVLINTLDGVATPNGLIMFVTTNYKERLDAALVRAGRMDCDIEMEPLNGDATAAMFEAFYGEGGAVIATDRALVPRTGAELQLIFMEESEPTRALARLMTTPKQRIHAIA